MMKSLSIIWTHMEGEGHPCAVCSDTGLSFLELLSSVRPLIERDGITVTFEEITVNSSQDSAEIGFTLNGHPLEELVRESDRAQFLCHSSKCQVYTASVEVTRNEKGARCFMAPEILFRKAILRSLEDD